MKIRSIVLIFLVSVIVLFFAFECSRAGPAPVGSPKIGVVSIQRVFEQSKRNAEYRVQTDVEQDKVVAELDRLSKEIEAERAGLRTLKTGSSDQLALLKGLMEKQAKLQATQEFHKQEMTLKDQRWTEQLYEDVLRVTREVAEEKGLDLVFENSEPELPALSMQELVLSVRTHKLLYSGGCLDISEEVVVRLDKEK